jgi:nucleoside-diphosphate-sugar epimerase
MREPVTDCVFERGRLVIYLIGGNGFVGSAFTRFFKRRQLAYRVIDRDNHHCFREEPCDVLINANGNSKKFLADSEPAQEFDASVRSVLASLTDLRFRHYVYLSSGDVYPQQDSPASTIEDSAVDVEGQSRYGLHKYLAEQLVRRYADSWLILRMGGFVGPHLKKNAIFDMLTHSPLWLTPDSELQFIHTDSAAEMVWELVEKRVSREIVNLGATGVVHLGRLHAQLGSRSVFRGDARQVRFELSLEKLGRLLGRELPQSQREVARFAAEWAQQGRAAS